jgi:chromate transport protein ChrA
MRISPDTRTSVAPDAAVIQNAFYAYHTEPLGPAWALLAVFTVFVILVPGPARPVTAMLYSGPLAWMAVQALRRGRGVRFGPAQLSVQMMVSRRTVLIPFDQIQAWEVTARDELAIAFLAERPAEDGEEPRPPRLRVTVSAPLADPIGLSLALRARALDSLPMPVGQLRTLLGMRRVRRILLWCAGLFIVLPTVVVILFRSAFAAISLFR